MKNERQTFQYSKQSQKKSTRIHKPIFQRIYSNQQPIHLTPRSVQSNQSVCTSRYAEQLQKHINHLKNDKKNAQEQSIWDCCSSYCEDGEVQVDDFNLYSYQVRMVKEQNPKRKLMPYGNNIPNIFQQIEMKSNKSRKTNQPKHQTHTLSLIDSYLQNTFQPEIIQDEFRRRNYQLFLKNKLKKNTGVQRGSKFQN